MSIGLTSGPRRPAHRFFFRFHSIRSCPHQGHTLIPLTEASAAAGSVYEADVASRHDLLTPVIIMITSTTNARYRFEVVLNFIPALHVLVKFGMNLPTPKLFAAAGMQIYQSRTLELMSTKSAFKKLNDQRGLLSLGAEIIEGDRKRKIMKKDIQDILRLAIGRAM